MASDSERDISVGGVANVPAGVFDGVDYVALGHLHGRQTLTETVRYCGSPLAYSFSEAGQVKGCWLVDLGADGVERAEFVAAPVPRRLATGPRPARRPAADPAPAREDAWLQVTLTDARRPRAAMERLRAPVPAHPGARVSSPRARAAAAARSCPRVDGRSDLDVALGFVAEVRELEATTEEALLLQLACDSCRIDEDRDADFSPRPPRPWADAAATGWTVTAFGPFAGTETVDFDALNDAGLFLLTGPTGAGKTSLLDAVCFALYGRCPGARGVKTLKSQHAADRRRPEVVLDFSDPRPPVRRRRSPGVVAGPRSAATG